MQFPFTLKKEADFDVVGFGTNAVDFLIQVPHYPEFNSKVELTDYHQAAGGEIATSMAGLQRLGLRTSYIGRFGTDNAGDIGLGSRRHEGVDLTYALPSGRCTSKKPSPWIAMSSFSPVLVS